MEYPMFRCSSGVMSATSALNGWNVTLKEPSIRASIITPKANVPAPPAITTNGALGIKNMAIIDTNAPNSI
jgi:hypothetical protein